jgi:hypothetical protein
MVAAGVDALIASLIRWLQAWTLNREPPSTPIQPTTHQLCLRLNISQYSSQVTASELPLI